MNYAIRPVGQTALQEKYDSEQSALNAADVIATLQNRDYEVCKLDPTMWDEWPSSYGWQVIATVSPGRPFCNR